MKQNHGPFSGLNCGLRAFSRSLKKKDQGLELSFPDYGRSEGKEWMEVMGRAVGGGGGGFYSLWYRLPVSRGM